MNTQRNASETAPAPSAPGTTPGEFSHYYLNFLSLFGKRRGLQDVQDMAHAAVALRDAEKARFDEHLQGLYDGYLAQTSATAPRACVDPAPLLDGWDALDLEAIRREHGGLLIALFHYGRHRQVLADLSVLGVPFIAPVAKRSYFEVSRVCAVSTPGFDHAMRLIEVESPRVGRDLLKGLRSGRIGLIYVDGNMGPDGHRVEEGAVEIDFLQRRIRVKEGVARLAHSMQLPVLPMFVSPQDASATSLGHVCVGPLLHPCAPRSSVAQIEASRQRMMQSMYALLGAQIEQVPAPWEFAFCLHRWIVDSAPPVSLPHADVPLPATLALRQEEVALYEREGEQYWVEVSRQKAFRLPAWAHGLYGFFVARARTASETRDWLQARQPQPPPPHAHIDADALLGGLHARGLLHAT